MSQEQVSYQTYLTQSEHLTLTDMNQLHQTILTAIDPNDADFQEIWQDLIQTAIKYTVIRAGWGALSRSERMTKDSARTKAHNAVLDNFIILERLCQKNGWPSQAWTEKLFLQAESNQRTKTDITTHRQRIGDFANYLAFIYALNNR
ncbi:hypothetical protein [Lapidilactobacillus bayanensis]|uniref:hypothetical protein n=1 Tax=Lapidilactobacillus bayanensis TaxID=2485998 RepID=UPI000F76DF35|nr:hypothetical protein [Lapidilactobacillus bayanensis]